MVFPLPDLPIIAIIFPASIDKLNPSKINLLLVPSLYPNFTFLNSIFPFIVSLFGIKFFGEIYIFGTLSYKLK